MAPATSPTHGPKKIKKSQNRTHEAISWACNTKFGHHNRYDAVRLKNILSCSWVINIKGNTTVLFLCVIDIWPLCFPQKNTEDEIRDRVSKYLLRSHGQVMAVILLSPFCCYSVWITPPPPYPSPQNAPTCPRGFSLLNDVHVLSADILYARRHARLALDIYLFTFQFKRQECR